MSCVVLAVFDEVLLPSPHVGRAVCAPRPERLRIGGHSLLCAAAWLSWIGARRCSGVRRMLPEGFFPAVAADVLLFTAGLAVAVASASGACNGDWNLRLA